MLTRIPDYYGEFRCWAGECPHTCCAKWEVVIDEETACRYAAMPGELGDKLRNAMRRDADGDVCFPLNGGRCPFLDTENLCEIHRALGAEATSVTCQEHPRFIEDYGSFREITLSASCPAVNALLLGSMKPLEFVAEETDEPEEAGDEWLEYLLPLRKQMLELLADRSHPLKERMGNLLLLALEAQFCLDDDAAEELPELAANWTWQKVQVSDAVTAAGLETLKELEILEPDWRELLEQAGAAGKAEVPEELLERIGVYMAFRYLLKAVNDGDLLSRVQMVVLTVLVVERLAAVCGAAEALRRFSCEIEHSDENLEMLQAAFQEREQLSWQAFLQE